MVSEHTARGTTPAQRARQGLWRGGKLRASAKERGSEAWAHAPSDCEQAGGGGSQIGDRARAPPVCIRVAPVCIPATARMGTPCMWSSSARRRRHRRRCHVAVAYGGSHMGARRYAYGWPRYAYRGVRHTGDNSSTRLHDQKPGKKPFQHRAHHRTSLGPLRSVPCLWSGPCAGRTCARAHSPRKWTAINNSDASY